MKSIFLGFSFTVIALILGWCNHAKFNVDQPSEDLLLIRNMDNIKALPRNFRLTTSAYQRHSGPVPTRKGLSKVRASGSSQFSKKGLRALLKAIPSKKVILVDLRQESHGFFDGIAVSWYGEKNWQNSNKTIGEIETDQKLHLNEAIEKGFVRIRSDKRAQLATPFHVEEAFSEKELAEGLSIPYVRFYVTDHKRPDDYTVDAFIEFIKNLDEDAWIHFHCAAGKGRTTSFLVMYDIVKNSQEVSFEDILRRQWFLGGADLTAQAYGKNWKFEPALERLKFLESFYYYCKANPSLEISWSDYQKQLQTRTE